MFARAYHTIILPDASVMKMAVACFDNAGCFVDCHPLESEEPFVEWVGGTLDLRKIKKVLPGGLS